MFKNVFRQQKSASCNVILHSPDTFFDSLTPPALDRQISPDLRISSKMPLKLLFETSPKIAIFADSLVLPQKKPLLLKGL